MLDLIGLWICSCLMVECLDVMSPLSLESAILADSMLIENILAIYMFVLFLSWSKASMFLNKYGCLSIIPLHALMIIGC